MYVRTYCVCVCVRYFFTFDKETKAQQQRHQATPSDTFDSTPSDSGTAPQQRRPHPRPHRVITEQRAKELSWPGANAGGNEKHPKAPLPRARHAPKRCLKKASKRARKENRGAKSCKWSGPASANFFWPPGAQRRPKKHPQAAQGALSTLRPKRI